MSNLFSSAPSRVRSTPFSEFIRNASSGQKKRVYSQVIDAAISSQRRVIEAAASKKK